MAKRPNVHEQRPALTLGETMDDRQFAGRLLIIRGLLSTAIALLGLAAGSLPVAAECDGPIPSFRDALETATRVVIGDVIAVHRGGIFEEDGAGALSSRFTVRVRFTPVGEAPETMEIADLPTQPCATVVMARKGDRIALAFDATDFTPPIHVNTVAWIRGAPPDVAGAETITTAEVFRLLNLAEPDTATADDHWATDAPILALIGVAAAALAGVLAGRRPRRADHRKFG